MKTIGSFMDLKFQKSEHPLLVKLSLRVHLNNNCPLRKFLGRWLFNVANVEIQVHRSVNTSPRAQNFGVGSEMYDRTGRKK
jgi:hypothetical protein